MAYFALAAGHGKNDSGAVKGSRYEKNDNLKISLAVGSELEKRGHRVIQYRTTDAINCDYADCRRWLEKTKADFAIVFHRNSFSYTSANGVEVWSFDADKKSSDIATALSTKIAAVSGMYNRGRKGNGAAWLSAKVPCCEPEIGFVSNSGDNSKFDKSFNDIVKGICDTLENYFGKVKSKKTGVIAKGTAKDYLNIRKSPVNGAVLTSIPKGEVCDIYSVENDWAKVSYKGFKGFSSAQYLDIEYIKKDIIVEKPSQTSGNAPKTEDKEQSIISPKEEEEQNMTPSSPCNEKTEDSLDETVPIFIKLLKKIVEIIVKLWRK